MGLAIADKVFKISDNKIKKQWERQVAIIFPKRVGDGGSPVDPVIVNNTF